MKVEMGYESMGYVRSFPYPISDEEIHALESEDFLQYWREMIWDKISNERHGTSFSLLTPNQKLTVDLDTMTLMARVILK